MLLVNEKHMSEGESKQTFEHPAAAAAPAPKHATLKSEAKASSRRVTLDIEHLFATYTSRAWHGTMTRADFDSCVEYLMGLECRNTHDLALCDTLFDVFDTNRNGRIEWHEFFVGMAMLCTASVSQILEVSFRMFDLDGNGLISPDELRGMLARLLPRHTTFGNQLEEIMQEIRREASWSYDGQISWAEFSRTLGGYKLSQLVTPQIQEHIRHLKGLLEVTDHSQA